MPYGLYISAEGARAQASRLETLANNLANVDTPGFKRDLSIFQARLTEATQQGRDFPGSRSVNDLSGGVRVRETTTDFSPGTMRRTDLPTDMAINGEGFFVVQKGTDKLLTRAGNFQLTGNGTLVTQDGQAVMSDAGNPVVIDPDAGPWHITPDGSVDQNGDVTPLAMVKPKSYGDLVKVGDNNFSALAAPTPLAPEERQVSAGYLEMSGVKPTLEMMDLIESSRGFEANTNLIRNQDQMLSSLVNRLLKA
ncbi:MAG TPA: flagellar basal-body rod protein FlgF [Pirellulales bacterium]|nr:flagellar basal-body rod protein FlgF [Pirellulales bacterium]